MDKDRIRHAQDFLIVHGLEGPKRILDIECLLSLHSSEIVVGLIDELIRDCKAKLKRHIRRDKTDPRVDLLLSKIFRLKMSKNTLMNGINHNQQIYPADAA